MAKTRTKPGPKPRPPNLNDFIRSKAVHARVPEADDIRAMLVSLLYDTPEDHKDANGTPRGKLKLDILMALHKINVDEAAVDGDGDLDAQLLEMLANRQRRRKPNAQQPKGTQEAGEE